MLYKSIASACAFASAVMVSAEVSAQTNPRILLQNSPVYALNNEVRAFRVPTTNSAGVVTFFDVVVRLGVSARGQINPTAIVTSTRSPSITSGVVPAGTYEASDGTTCRVSNTTLNNGRVQSAFSCSRRTEREEFFVATGAVVAGHPFLQNLQAQGIPTIPEVNTKNWGIVAVGGAISGCPFSNPTALGSVSNGSDVTISLYLNRQSYCGFILTRQ